MVARLPLREGVRSSVIREGLGVELLRLCIKKNRLTVRFGHLTRTRPRRAISGISCWEDALGQTQYCWRD